MATSADTVDGKDPAMDVALVPQEVKALITVLKGQVFLLGKDWDNLRDPERKELAQSAVETVTELNELVRGEPDKPTTEHSLRIVP